MRLMEKAKLIVKDKQIFLGFFLFYFLIIFIAYKDVLTLPSVQDDAYSFMIAYRYRDFFTPIFTALQYRPLSWFIVYITNTLLGDSILSMRIASMFTLALNSVLLGIVAVRLTKLRVLGFVSGLLFALNHSNYFSMSLYLATAMHGSAFAFVLISLILFTYYTASNNREQKIIYYILSLIFAVAAFFTSEISIVIVPIVLFVLILSRLDFKNIAKSSVGIIKEMLLFGGISVIFFAIRMFAILTHDHTAVGATGALGNYGIGFDRIFSNLIYLVRFSFWSLTWLNTISNLFILFLLLIPIYFIIVKKDKILLLLYSSAFVCAIPFILLNERSIIPYYSFMMAAFFCIAIPYSMYLVYKNVIFSKRCKQTMFGIGIICCSAYIAFSIGVIWNAFPTHGLTLMAKTGNTVANQFEDIYRNRQFDDIENIFFINSDFAWANTFYFGYTINHGRQDAPLTFLFDYLHDIRDADKYRTLFVYATRNISNTFDLNVRLLDVSHIVRNNFYNDEFREELERFIARGSLRHFEQYEGTLYGIDGAFVHAVHIHHADVFRITDETRAQEFLFTFMNDSVQTGVLLVNENNSFKKVADIEYGTTVIISNMGAWDESTSSFLGLRITFLDGYWQVADSSFVEPFLHVSSQTNPGDIRISASSNSYEVIQYGDRIRVISQDPLSFLVLVEAGMVDVPVTIVGKVMSNPGNTVLMQIFNFITESEPVVHSSVIADSGEWENLFATHIFSATPYLNYAALGIFNTRAQAYFDIDYFIIHRGTFFRESFEG